MKGLKDVLYNKYMDPISKEIFAKAVAGDLEAFEAIYRETSGFVYNVAYRIVQNTQDAEEITQEVFVSVYRKLREFRWESSFRTWIYRITTNCALNRIKQMRKEKDREQGYYLEAEINRSDSPDGSRKETVDQLLKAINPDQRACVVLRNVEGLSYREIADSLKININTVRTRLKRAREKMLLLRKEVIKNEL